MLKIPEDVTRVELALIIGITAILVVILYLWLKMDPRNWTAY